MFKLPVVLAARAVLPFAVLSFPVVLASRAALPVAVLELPVVLELRAKSLDYFLRHET